MAKKKNTSQSNPDNSMAQPPSPGPSQEERDLATGQMLPDKVQEVLTRRGVTLRPEGSVFLNPITGVETVCTPEQFAVFEAAVNSLHASGPEHAEWCEKLAAANAFTIPKAASMPSAKDVKKAAKDVDTCRIWMNKQGLFHDFMGV